MRQEHICRDTIYRLIRPRRVGKKIEQPRVRSKRWRGRRWVSRTDLRNHFRSPPIDAELKPLSCH